MLTYILIFQFSDGNQITTGKNISPKSNKGSASIDNQKVNIVDRGSLQWTEKYRPKVPNDIVGNQSMVSASAFG